MITHAQALSIWKADPDAAANLLVTLSREVDMLKDRVRLLEERLAKNSRNSSKPPSSDGLNKPQPKSLRPPGIRPTGGQPGHQGQTLMRVIKPDRTEVHRITRCKRCGRSLTTQPPDGVEKRQVHDLPPTRLVVTEHQTEIKRCPCGHFNKAAFPEGINAPVQYGPGVKAAAVYLNNYQLLPQERTCELLADLFRCGISQGTLANLLAECHRRLDEPLQRIKDQIAHTSVAHFDESGARVDGKLWWLHAASTPGATYYDVHPKRGTKAFNAIGILSAFTGRAIHDFWKPYFDYKCSHGLCNAHHLRELIFLHEEHRQDWANAMIGCLLDIKAAVENTKTSADHLPKKQILDFEARYQRILDQGFACNPLPMPLDNAVKRRGRRKKTRARNLLERLDTHRSEVLAFMYDFRVPFDNNLAERDIRMLKVQQKISGQFRSTEGAEAFCRIRSYISTARKNALNAIDAIARVFTGNPFVPVINTS